MGKGRSGSHAAADALRATHSSCGVGALVDLGGNTSHRLVRDGLRVLLDLDHRGARGAEENTGDGAGLLLQKPHRFFSEVVGGLPAPEAYGVGQVFFPRHAEQHALLRALVERCIAAQGLRCHAWRRVPTVNAELGRSARTLEPLVEQVFVCADGLAPRELDIELYLLRRRIENAAWAKGFSEEQFYICSLSRTTVVYKGLLTSAQLASYYPELNDTRMESALVLVHARFSTNTLGAWHLAHPYRCIIHNGEINTLRGNLNWMKAREADLGADSFGAAIDNLKPVTEDGRSDSAVLDNVLELMLGGGRDLAHALRMMIPEAWEKDPGMPAARRTFYDFHSTLMEPWDGPALIVATDGERVAAILDRNGLRPCRYCLTDDNILVLASEAGVLDLPPAHVTVKARLRPGQLLLADPTTKRIVPEDEIFTPARAARYQHWLDQYRVRLSERRGCTDAAPPSRGPALPRLQQAFGYTVEWLRYMLQPMANDGKDPLGSMGSDTPPAALSAFGKPLFNYFHQGFAQVSNPPIDFLREALMTSLACHVGRKGNLLAEGPQHCRQVLLDSPILEPADVDRLHHLNDRGIRASDLDITFDGDESLRQALTRLGQRAEAAVRSGAEILILDDRRTAATRLAMPSLMAVGGVHHHLIRAGLRTRAALILVSGEPCLVHHVCTLVGYGADGVCPWLAFETVEQLVAEGLVRRGRDEARRYYRHALEQGLLKVMSKMGISTLASYKGAQIFEAVGLDHELVDACFAGTRARLPGVGFQAIDAEVRARHAEGFADPPPVLAVGGDLYWRRSGELHQWNPLTIGKLQQAARHDDAAAYRAFADAVDGQDDRLQTLRGLLELTPGAPIALEEVEPAEAIMRRFATASMSFGALSQEAHEAVAVAANRIGAKSGSGEGGEQVKRFGTEASCSMKQVASGRFGVTLDYLNNAAQIEIKMAQGSKPGEGGELPGGKVDEGIAAVRFTTPGVGLISPPPHHDIYSIEDLAQLIHDLKCANPSAEIHVKLVATGGVGTIAAGVAKARADAVLISGDAGGTGASLKTSIKSAGLPWELGLAETQQMLLANNLRSRIRVRADGGFKTGRDVVIAALLGAEEFGFGTAPLIALGCLMLRKCHCNTCSVGIATQDPALRRRFAGRPEHVINYLRLVAEDVRRHMAALGFATMDSMIGRVDRLRARRTVHPRGYELDVSELLYRPPSDDASRNTGYQQHHLEDSLDQGLIRRAAPALRGERPVAMRLRLRNRDRSVGAMLSSAVAKARPNRALPADGIVVWCTGSAGQSFGAFLAPGIGLHLVGEANDYVAKGLSGGRLSVRPPDSAAYTDRAHVIIGNVALYGATAGEVYCAGLAGERFAVRNSGALAVVEGVGDHGCEYMTGGVVLILGSVGRNFAAGMSGGEVYVLDEHGALETHCNRDMVHLEPLREERDHAMVRRLLENHYAYTGSTRAEALLVHWDRFAPLVTKVVPDAYAEVVAQALRRGRDVRPPLPLPCATAAQSTSKRVGVLP